ncbi:unnamed protein product [Cunninghamella blakesleeana]
MSTNMTDMVLSFFMVIAPVFGYIDQYRIIYQSKTSQGFNVKVCGILLIANILRIFYWIGERFDKTLLLQSIVMIFSQLFLLEIVIRYRPITEGNILYDDRSSISSLSIEADHPWVRAWHKRKLFWNWPDMMDYLNFLLAFTTCCALLFMFLYRIPYFIEILGIISLGIESTLPIPQCISNFKNRSVEGFSLLVLLSWFIGDSFKVFYYIFTRAPFQFIGCGITQLSVDILIVFECILFSSMVKKWFGIRSSDTILDRYDYEPIN